MAMGIARVLIVAGSDSGGGAGIQADVKTVTCLGGYAMTAVTALTAQNTQGVFGIQEVSPDFIAQQMRLVLDDIGADVVKTGMLHSAGVIDTVAEVLQEYAPPIRLVLDPVMVAKGGHALLQPDAVMRMKERLFPLAALVTPNVPEAELLAGIPIHNVEDMQRAARMLLGTGAKAVLVKGGHLGKDELIHNVLVFEGGEVLLSTRRIDTPHTHGTGCTLASAIAVSIAQGLTLPHAVERAQDYVATAIASAPELGRGHGPIKHNFMIV